MTLIKKLLTVGSLASLAAFASVAAHAQDYPNRAIRFIAPIPAGGSTEVLAREVAQQMSARLGQPVVVENKPGGAGSIGSAVVASAPPDGYTILLVNSSHSINPHVYKNLPFDAVKDFAPVSLMIDLPMVLLVNSSFPAKTLSEFIAMAKAKPEALSFASSGNGGAGHLTGQIFQKQTGTKMVHVPYRGSALAMNDLVANQVPAMVSDAALAAPYIKSGAVRALAITSAKRTSVLPDVPTFDEAGIKGMDVSIWVGVLTTGGTPAPIVKKLSDTIAAILKEPAFAAKQEARGFNIVASTPEEFSAVIKKDYERFGVVVREAGVKAE